MTTLRIPAILAVAALAAGPLAAIAQGTPSGSSATTTTTAPTKAAPATTAPKAAPASDASKATPKKAPVKKKPKKKSKPTPAPQARNAASNSASSTLPARTDGAPATLGPGTYSTGPTVLKDKDGKAIPTNPNAYPIDSARK